MTEPNLVDAEATKVIGKLPKGVTLDPSAVSEAIGAKLRSITTRDLLRAVKFNTGSAVELPGNVRQFLASASVEPHGENTVDGPPMRTRVLNVVVTIEDDEILVDLPFYASR